MGTNTPHRSTHNPFKSIYGWGLAALALLPLLNLPPWFSPPGWGNTLVFRVVLGGLAMLAIWQALFRPWDAAPISLSRTARAILRSLAVLLGVFFLSSALSPEPVFSFWGDPMRAWGFVNYAFYALFALALLWALRTQEQWRLVWGSFVLTGILLVAIAFFQQAGALSDILVGAEVRPGSTLGNPLFLSAFILPLTFLALSLGITERAPARFFFLGSIPVFLFGLLLALSRSGFLGLGAGALLFLLLYPNKPRFLKSAAAGIAAVITGIVILANVFPSPGALEGRTFVQNTWGHLSLSSVAESDRFDVWRAMKDAILERPVLGYGMYNISIAFDRHYSKEAHPLIPPSGKNSWFDSSHNIFVDIAVWAGIPGLLAFLTFLFFVLYALRRAVLSPDRSIALRAHGTRTALAAYLVHMMFVFDVFSTSLVFFAITAYAMYLSSRSEGAQEYSLAALPPVPFLRSARTGIFPALLAGFAFFAWQFNVMPFTANAAVNTAGFLVRENRCDEATVLIQDEIGTSDTFVNAYANTSFLEYLRDCANRAASREERLHLHKIAYDAARKAAELRPSYTRTWLFLSGFSSSLLQAELQKDAPDPGRTAEYEAITKEALDKAEMLSPGREEVYLAQIRSSLVIGRSKEAGAAADACASLGNAFTGCQWYQGLVRILEGRTDEGWRILQNAEDLGFHPQARDLLPLADALVSAQDYPRLAATYERLISMDDQNPQLYASLAVAYRNLGEYEKARQAALGVLQLQPGNKGVEEFLQTLPR